MYSLLEKGPVSRPERLSVEARRVKYRCYMGRERGWVSWEGAASEVVWECCKLPQRVWAELQPKLNNSCNLAENMVSCDYK